MSHVEIESCRIVPSQGKVLVAGYVVHDQSATIQVEFLNQQCKLPFDAQEDANSKTKVASWTCDFDLPENALPETASVRVSLDGVTVEHTSFEVERAVYISTARIELGILKVTGWSCGRGPDDFVDVLVFGKHKGIARSVRRPDIAKKFPVVSDEAPGFEFEMELPDAMVDAHLWIGARLRNKDSIHSTASLEVSPPVQTASSARLATRALLNPAAPLGALRAMARVMTPLGRRRLLASRAFHRLWAIDSLPAAIELRKQVVQAMFEFAEIDGAVDIRIKSGHLINVDPIRDSVIARKFMIDGTYEEGLIDSLSRLIETDDTVFDVGSCYGHVAMACAQFVGDRGKVVAVEPNPDMADGLRTTLRFNRVQNISVEECALGAAPGEVQLRVAPRNVGASRLAIKGVTATEAEFGALLSSLSTISLDAESFGEASEPDANIRNQSLHTVKMKTLDALAQEHGCPKLIKIDIEGAEYLCLKGAHKLLSGDFGPQPIISMEYSNLFPTFGGKREDAFNLLIEHGYSAFRMRAGKVHGGDLVEVPSAEDGPDHDDLFFLPRAG